MDDATRLRMLEQRTIKVTRAQALALVAICYDIERSATMEVLPRFSLINSIWARVTYKSGNEATWEIYEDGTRARREGVVERVRVETPAEQV